MLIKYNFLKADDILISSEIVFNFVTKIINKAVHNAEIGIIHEFVTKSKKSYNVIPNG